jgi:hypothetical protein
MKKILLIALPLAVLVGLWRLSGPAIAIIAAALVGGAAAWIQRLLATNPKGLFVALRVWCGIGIFVSALLTLAGALGAGVLGLVPGVAGLALTVFLFQFCTKKASQPG